MIAQTVGRDGSIWWLYGPSNEPEPNQQAREGHDDPSDPQERRGGDETTDTRDDDNPPGARNE